MINYKEPPNILQKIPTLQQFENSHLGGNVALFCKIVEMLAFSTKFVTALDSFFSSEAKNDLDIHLDSFGSLAKIGSFCLLTRILTRRQKQLLGGIKDTSQRITTVSTLPYLALPYLTLFFAEL